MKKNIKKNYSKIGILGGTFDPPHTGHLHISRVAAKKLKLNKIFWIITKKNPVKKKAHYNKQTRIALSKKITRNDKKIFVYFLENKIKSIYTYKLLEYIKIKNPKSKLYFLIGADNLKKLHTWKKWKKIVLYAKIAVFPRKDYSFNSVASKKLSKNEIIYIKTKKINISSSLIRKFWLH